MKTYVLGFLFSKDKKYVALIHKKRPTWQNGLVNGIGGKKEEGESPHYAMRREFKEETGLDVESWKRRIILTSDIEKWVVHVFTARVSIDVLRSCKTMEDEEVFICDVDGLPSNVIFNLRWIIPLLNDGVEFPIKIKDVKNYV